MHPINRVMIDVGDVAADGTMEGCQQEENKKKISSDPKCRSEDSKQY